MDQVGHQGSAGIISYWIKWKSGFKTGVDQVDLQVQMDHQDQVEVQDLSKD
jgi:hypothetical protein